MPSEMAIRVSDGPTHGLVRIYTEQTAWDEPDARYLRRKPIGKTKSPPQECLGENQVVFEFGNVQVSLRAVNDHVEVFLCRLPVRFGVAA
jgi:hypothetical protein